MAMRREIVRKLAHSSGDQPFILVRGNQAEIGVTNTDQYYPDGPGILQGSSVERFGSDAVVFVLPSSALIRRR
jgi:hypothetical protein